MGNTEKNYYFIDINLITMKICEWGVSQTATLTGDTDNPDIHRIFLTKGQYNKLVCKLDLLALIENNINSDPELIKHLNEKRL